MRKDKRGTGFPLIGVRGGDSGIWEPLNGLPPGICCEVSSSDIGET